MVNTITRMRTSLLNVDPFLISVALQLNSFMVLSRGLNCPQVTTQVGSTTSEVTLALEGGDGGNNVGDLVDLKLEGRPHTGLRSLRLAEAGTVEREEDGRYLEVVQRQRNLFSENHFQEDLVEGKINDS